MSRSEANPLDVESIDAIISAAYDSISGPPGKRDWNRERSLFIPGARLIPMAENAGETSPGGEITPHMLVDRDHLLAARKYRASNSGKIFVGKHTLNAQFRRESALSDGCGRQMHL